MSQVDVKGEDIEEAKVTMCNILDVVNDRIDDLRLIWRRQRLDVDVQMRYYVNGLFQDYYKKHLEDFRTEHSDWSSGDEWGSEDDDQRGSNATSGVQNRPELDLEHNQGPARETGGGYAEDQLPAPAIVAPRGMRMQQDQRAQPTASIGDDSDDDESTLRPSALISQIPFTSRSTRGGPEADSNSQGFGAEEHNDHEGEGGDSDHEGEGEHSARGGFVSEEADEEEGQRDDDVGDSD